MAYSKKPLIGIIMGSSSDSRIMQGASEILDQFGIKHEDQIISAHRTPSRLSEYAQHAEEMGFKIIIAGAGGAAHLPGMVASHTVIPVIGVPILVYNDKSVKKPDTSKFSAFGGLDSLLSITEMPSGFPCRRCWGQQGRKCRNICNENDCKRISGFEEKVEDIQVKST